MGLSGRQAKNLCGSVWQTGGQLLTLQSMVSSLAKSSKDRVGGEGLQHQHNQLHSSWIHRQGWGMLEVGGGGGGLQHQHSSWIHRVGVCVGGWGLQQNGWQFVLTATLTLTLLKKKYSQNPHVQKSFSMYRGCTHLLELVKLHTATAVF